jgi:uncharacterized protein YbjQ (UPF0145 family)
MQCKKCGRDYPSMYYFQTKFICKQCYTAMTEEEKVKANKEQFLLDPAMTTTTFNLEGFRIAKQLGVVRGIIVRSRSFFGTIGGALHTLVGGNITLFTELCEKTREDAYETMINHALEIGANAVIGVRYDATELMSGVTEVLCYGTAVVVERIK